MTLTKDGGAAEGTRTPDPIITNDVLYQLSYCGPTRDPAKRTGRTAGTTPCGLAGLIAATIAEFKGDRRGIGVQPKTPVLTRGFGGSWSSTGPGSSGRNGSGYSVSLGLSAEAEGRAVLAGPPDGP